MKLLLLSLCGLLCMLASCSPASQSDAEADSSTTHASLLRIVRDGNATVARIVNPQDTNALLGIYIFPDTDTTTLAATPQGAVVLPPSALQNLMVYSAVHGSALKELGALEAIKVVGDAAYFTVPEVQQRLKSGDVIDGGSQQEPVKERIIKAKPAAVLVSWYPGMDASGIERLGVPVIYLAESQEEDPLGRAEWLKLLGLIARNPAKADSIFNSVASNYASLKQTASNVSKRPKVMAETMYEGVWNVAGGRSYAARMIADAGGDYPWKDDDSTGSLTLPFESVLAKASDSDIWLIRLFGSDLTLNWLREADERYMLFRPAQAGGVWGCNTVAVPFYEETPFHPDLLLRDYIAIFHPGLLPGVSPRYFKKAE